AFDPAAASERAQAAAEHARTVDCPGAACLALLVSARLAGSSQWAQAARSFEHDGAIHLAPAVSCYLDRIVPAGGVSVTTPLHDPAHASPGTTGDHAPRMPIAPVLLRPPATTGAAAAPPSARATVQDLLDAANALACPIEAFLPTERPATPPADPPLQIRRDGEPPQVEVLCLGSFSLLVGGRAIDVSAAKPRLRSLLYRLALDTGRPVHRDQLRNALWPDDNERAGTRNLQVAVSALRQQLEYLGGPGTGVIVARRGDGYLLDAGAGGSDLGRFEDAAGRGRRARRGGARREAIDALRTALALYRGELLADEGTSEWVLDERERLRLLAAETAQLLAECLLEDGDAAGAVEVAERGVWIDRYNDRLWRVMIEAHERNGNPAAAARSSRQYATVLDELGVAGEMAAER
ncbi:MAG: winged helix-turn-helix domain-containing protein, partial [Acidimicrobiaceae bacterium]|nr:winged helix-turn-helix domain-containing protein [Acidimicrobiaceae bacterium]